MIFTNNCGLSQVIESKYLCKIAELKQQYPNCTTSDEKLDLAFYTALSFFPKLAELHINMRFEPIETSMQCRPEFSSFFSTNRKYVIKVNYDSLNPIYPLKASFSALVGCIGHELAHIVRYESQSKSEILSDGIKFVSSKEFRSFYEKETDKITITHGLGYEQYEYAKFIFENPNISADYLEFKKSIYHTPEELLKLHNQHHSK